MKREFVNLFLVYSFTIACVRCFPNDHSSLEPRMEMEYADFVAEFPAEPEYSNTEYFSGEYSEPGYADSIENFGSGNPPGGSLSSLDSTPDYVGVDPAIGGILNVLSSNESLLLEVDGHVKGHAKGHPPPTGVLVEKKEINIDGSTGIDKFSSVNSPMRLYKSPTEEFSLERTKLPGIQRSPKSSTPSPNKNQSSQNPKQLKPGVLVPLVFEIQLKDSNPKEQKEEEGEKDYHGLTQVDKRRYVSYGKDALADFVSGGIPGVRNNSKAAKKSTLAIHCQLTEDVGYKICASDGKTYKNLGQFFCAQQHSRNLTVIFDGPCDRTEWPSAVLDRKLNKLMILNPSVIVKYHP